MLKDFNKSGFLIEYLEEDNIYNLETKKGTFDFIPFGQVNTCITGPNIKF